MPQEEHTKTRTEKTEEDPETFAGQPIPKPQHVALTWEVDLSLTSKIGELRARTGGKRVLALEAWAGHTESIRSGLA